jgi:hypothetical protein
MNPERRAWPRAEVRLRVWVLGDGHKPIAYAARNLSAGGALIADGPALQPARDLKLMMPLRGRDLVLHARVLRCEPDAQGRPCAALALRGVPTFVQDLIQNQVLGAAPRMDSAANDQGNVPLR